MSSALSAVVSGLPAVVVYEGRTGRQRSEAEILRDLGRLKAGDIAYGHVNALPSLRKFLCQDSFATYFILRDPRDVVVSHVHYITEMQPNHIHHTYYRDTLKTFDQRLSASIMGITSADLQSTTKLFAQETLPDIRSHFEPYLGWLGCPEVMVLRFEDFIIQPQETIGAVARPDGGWC